MTLSATFTCAVFHSYLCGSPALIHQAPPRYCWARDWLHACLKGNLPIKNRRSVACPNYFKRHKRRKKKCLCVKMLSTSDIKMAISIFRQSITDLFWNTRWPCLQIIQGMSEQLSACTTVTHTSTHNVIRPNRRLGPLIKLRNQLLNTPPPHYHGTSVTSVLCIWRWNWHHHQNGWHFACYITMLTVSGYRYKHLLFVGLSLKCIFGI